MSIGSANERLQRHARCQELGAETATINRSTKLRSKHPNLTLPRIQNQSAVGLDIVYD
jgi:hypothetical protein